MKKFKKAVSALGIVTLMFSSTYSNVFAIDGRIYEKTNQEVISTGVTHKHILRFNKDGWLNANVVYVDLDNNGIELDLLQSSKGVTTKETLSTMVKARDNVVTAINADFFYYTNPDSPLGAMVKEGKVISSPVFVENFATLAVDQNNTASASYWQYGINVTNQEGNSVPVTTINKYTHEYQSIMIIDRNWGANTPGYNEKHYDMVEVIVVEDEVVEVRRKEGPTAIPQNGYVILASQGNAQTLYDNFKVGDKLTVHTNITPNNLDNIKLAIGGGTVLVKGGQVADFTQNLSGNAPRTAVGITQDRRQLILVAVDGRHNYFKGVNGQGLANLMIELGSYEAIVMDGGGSTTMMTRGLGEFNPQLINYPSDGGERRIINGLAVVSQEPQGEVKGIKAEFNYDKSFVGASRNITVKAFDINNNPLNVDTSQLRFAVKRGEGSFIGNKFIPTTSGKNIIEVDYLGAKTEVILDVLEEISLLKVSPDSLSLSYGQSVTPKIVGVDKKGYSTTIEAKDIVWEDATGLGTLKDGVYTAGSISGTTTLVATFGNKTVNIPISIGSDKVSLGDLDKYLYKFNSYPETVKGNITLDNNAKVGENSLKLEYDFSASDATRAAYIEFEKGSIKLPSGSLKIGLWAYAFENGSGWIRGNIKDVNGTRHTIDFTNAIDWTGWKYLEANIPQNISMPMELERIYVVETNAAIQQQGKLLFDGLDVTQSLKTEGTTTGDTLKDYLNAPYTTRGTQFFIHSGITYGTTSNEAKNMVTQRIQDLVNKNYNLSIFTSTVDSSITSGVNKDYTVGTAGYSSKEVENNLILHLDNRSGGLRATNYKQWSWLINHLEATTKENIFVVLPRPIWGTNGFSDELEANLLKEKLTETTEKGKKVFVLYGGTKDVNVDLIDGVRYISTGTYNSTAATSSKYIEFNILKDQVTYQVKSLFK